MRHRALVAAAALLVSTASPARGQSIPTHPREIKFPKLDYTPPKAARYRTVLAGGVVAYMVEDHELPLVNVSLTIRAGSYLDPRRCAQLVMAEHAVERGEHDRMGRGRVERARLREEYVGGRERQRAHEDSG